MSGLVSILLARLGFELKLRTGVYRRGHSLNQVGAGATVGRKLRPVPGTRLRRILELARGHTVGPECGRGLELGVSL